MGMDSAGTEHQLFSDLEVGQAPSQQAYHLHLACRQSGRIGGRWSQGGGRGRSWLLPLCSECLPRGHGSSLGPGGSEGSLSQVHTRSRERALIVSEFDGRDRDANRVPESVCCSPELCRPC